PDGKWLICATDESKILLLNLTNSVELEKELTGHTKMVIGIAIAPNNKFFISSSNDKTIRKWDLKTFKSELLVESESKINKIEISPDSKLVVAGMQNGNINIWNVNNPEDLQVIESESKNAISAVAYNRNGKWLVTGDSRGNVRIRNSENFEVIDNLEGHRSRIYDIDFNPENNLMATSSLDGTVRVWDCTNLNNQPIVLKDHESWVLSISFSPDGKRLVTSSNKKDRILIWPTTSDFLAHEVLKGLERDMTIDEWNAFVAQDVEYEKTYSEPNNQN
ncbi:MAG: WD40 repeat domain-containing protein, partial [Bacteroidales bacterium]|nr:WD40 repeat domain-containing protein [Bacteroidales bacterium]